MPQHEVTKIAKPIQIEMHGANSENDDLPPSPAKPSKKRGRPLKYARLPLDAEPYITGIYKNCAPDQNPTHNQKNSTSSQSHESKPSACKRRVGRPRKTELVTEEKVESENEAESDHEVEERVTRSLRSRREVPETPEKNVGRKLRGKSQTSETPKKVCLTFGTKVMTVVADKKKKLPNSCICLVTKIHLYDSH